MAKRLSVQGTLAKWKRNLAAASESYKDGIASVTESPGEKAAAAQDKYQAGVTEAVASGRYAERCRDVSLSDWKARATEGASRLASGAAKGEKKMQRHLSEFIPFVETVRAEIRGMPNGDKEQRRARMNANFDKMSEYKGRKGK